MYLHILIELSVFILIHFGIVKFKKRLKKLVMVIVHTALQFSSELCLLFNPRGQIYMWDIYLYRGIIMGPSLGFSHATSEKIKKSPPLSYFFLYARKSLLKTAQNGS